MTTEEAVHHVLDDLAHKITQMMRSGRTFEYMKNSKEMHLIDVLADQYGEYYESWRERAYR